MKGLDQVETPEDFRDYTIEELIGLAAELREFIIDQVAVNGGHLGASLGTVELSVALHYCFNTPNDKLVWDVGHQAYGHKILTGRKNLFHTNRQLNGLSGFPKRGESVYDAFGTGHSSTSISAILGMAVAAKIRNESREHIAVIGDASMQAGLSFEALNHAGVAGADMLVILNDNCMSIDPSVGALNEYFIREAKRLNPDAAMQLERGAEDGYLNFFETLNFSYFGPIDGHDIPKLVEALDYIKKQKGPRILHVLTRKGRGYHPAEVGSPTKWHAPGLFDKDTGEIKKAKTATKYQDVFGSTLVELAQKDESIVAITPAMPTGSSMNEMMELFPDRSFDVGIAEQHALTFAAGLSCDGLLPFVVIYSSFLQRAYDQLVHDIAIQNLNVVLCIDRAGLVGADGATHHGTYDMAFLRAIPNLRLLAPADGEDLARMMRIVAEEYRKGYSGPTCIRYPRGEVDTINLSCENLGPQLLSEGGTTAVISVGTTASDAAEAIGSRPVKHICLRQIKPFPTEHLTALLSGVTRIVTVEDGCLSGGVGSMVAEELGSFIRENAIELIRLGVPDEVVEHGTQDELKAQCGFDTAGIRLALGQ